MPTVKINGFPKHGNHALAKAVQLLGVSCEVEHVKYTPDALPRIFIKRDPRNALVSWLRFSGKPVTQGMFIAALSDFNGETLVAAMAEFEGWLSDANTLVIQYEDLIASDAALRQIADYLGVPYLDDAYPNLPGCTITWTGLPSDYTVVWTPEVEAAWEAAGGAALLTRWGY